jgi:hypothetical protein
LVFNSCSFCGCLSFRHFQWGILSSDGLKKANFLGGADGTNQLRYFNLYSKHPKTGKVWYLKGLPNGLKTGWFVQFSDGKEKIAIKI